MTQQEEAMTRTWMVLAGLLIGLVMAPASADAAKLRLGAKPVAVGADGRASLAVKNPNRRPARGRLTLSAQGTRVATARFRIPARRTKKVRVNLTVTGFARLQASGTLPVRATATAKGAGTTRKALRLRLTTGGEETAPGDTSTGFVAHEGRYQGRYAENNVDLAFNVVGSRLFTGPFDRFYIDATCRNVNPDYTGPDQVYTNANAIDPVDATIAADGTFFGEGLHRTGVTPPKPWRITGRITGDAITGEFSTEFTDAYGNPCSGLTRFTAAWYGAYTL
jgi:hypothetical protein